MGNTLGSKKAVKIMKINGDSFKLKTPVNAGTVVKDFPGHVLLESESVKRFGIKAKPLEHNQNLDSKRLYFIVELPRTWRERGLRRVRSGIEMSAKERLENLKMSRRSLSDLSVTKKKKKEEFDHKMSTSSSSVTLKLPKWKVEKLRKESESVSDFTNKITSLSLLNIQSRQICFEISEEEKVFQNLKSHEA
ncbi:unnamed protein product [Cochlearia groenlandica]